MSSVLKTYDPPIVDLSILYEDAHLLAFSKPSGLLSVPGKGDHLSDCMVSRVQAVYPEALLVHRLDMDTSGVFMMARDKATQANLGKQFERRKVKKIYIADVWGHPQEDTGLIDLPLRCDWPNRPLQMVCHEHGRPAQTKWRVLERKTSSHGLSVQSTCRAVAKRKRMDHTHKACDDDEVKIACLELEPLTGRSHQLRVHMKELEKEKGGHPILGDRFYATGKALAAAPYLMLHAQSITFHHPKDGHLVEVEDHSHSIVPGGLLVIS